MNENILVKSGPELRKNFVTGAVAGGMLGAALGYGFGSLWVGMVVGILLGLVIGYRIHRSPIKMQYPMYMIRRILLAVAFFFMVGMGYTVLIDRGWSGTRLVLAALVPIAAWAFLVICVGKAIASLDELQRRIQTESIAIGFAGTAIVCGGYGLLGFGGVVPALSWGIVLFVMIVMWFAGKMWTMWRYR